MLCLNRLGFYELFWQPIALVTYRDWNQIKSSSLFSHVSPRPVCVQFNLGPEHRIWHLSLLGFFLLRLKDLYIYPYFPVQFFSYSSTWSHSKTITMTLKLSTGHREKSRAESLEGSLQVLSIHQSAQWGCSYLTSHKSTTINPFFSLVGEVLCQIKCGRFPIYKQRSCFRWSRGGESRSPSHHSKKPWWHHTYPWSPFLKSNHLAHKNIISGGIQKFEEIKRWFTQLVSPAS